MSPNEHRRLRHARIKEILFEVSALEGTAREDFLGAACAGDREMRDEVESLLQYWDGRLDGVERAEVAPRGPARDVKKPSDQAATVSEVDLSSPVDKASGKAGRRPRKKSAR